LVDEVIKKFGFQEFYKVFFFLSKKRNLNPIFHD